MKKEIHPEYKETTVTCACGNVIHTRSTRSDIRVEICSTCHPFFTGKQKLVDTAGRVERFRRKYGLKETIEDTVEEQVAEEQAIEEKAIEEAPVVAAAAAGALAEQQPVEEKADQEESAEEEAAPEKAEEEVAEEPVVEEQVAEEKASDEKSAKKKAPQEEPSGKLVEVEEPNEKTDEQ